MPRPPTTREIARACDCSQSTVSNALRDDPRISGDTRTRIQTIARSMGWRANPLASAYMAHLRSTKEPAYRATLAFTISNPASPRVEDLPLYQQWNYAGARERAESLGYGIETVWLHEPGLNARNLTHILQARGIPGLLIPSFIQPNQVFEHMDWDAFASVAIGHALNGVSLDRATFNYNRSIPMALSKLYELGYRRIGVILSDTYDQKVGHGWLYPLYYEQQQGSKRDWVKSCIVPGTSGEDRHQVRAWIEQHRPDVILGEFLAWHVLNEMNWRIPDDVAFASFDWSSEHPDIGGIHQNHDVIGAQAVDLLTAQLLHNERGLASIPKLLQIDGQWRDGASVPLLAVPA